MIKTVILDFDGTIADTRGIILKTMRQTIDRMGYAQPDTERHEWYGLGTATQAHRHFIHTKTKIKNKI